MESEGNALLEALRLHEYHMAEGQELCVEYLAPDTGLSKEKFIARVIEHFDGPDQRAVQSAARDAMTVWDYHHGQEMPKPCFNPLCANTRPQIVWSDNGACFVCCFVCGTRGPSFAFDNVYFNGCCTKGGARKKAIKAWDVCASASMEPSPFAKQLREVFLPAILHGDEEHRNWLIEAVECFIDGRKIPPANTCTPADDQPIKAGDQAARIAELEEALRPFADLIHNSINDPSLKVLSDSESYPLTMYATVGDFRRAVNVLYGDVEGASDEQ